MEDVVFERPEEDIENTWKVRGPHIEIEEVKEDEEQSIGIIEVDESQRGAKSEMHRSDIDDLQKEAWLQTSQRVGTPQDTSPRQLRPEWAREVEIDLD